MPVMWGIGEGLHVFDVYFICMVRGRSRIHGKGVHIYTRRYSHQ